MKTNWQTRQLGEICDFHNGLWKGKKPPYINVGVIRNTNFTKDGTLNDADIAYLPVEVKQFSKRKLNLGDIILEKSGGGPKQPVGRVIVFDKKDGNYSFSNFTSVIRIKNSDEMDSSFLHKFLYFSYISGITESMQSHSTGIRNLDLSIYKKIKISFPSLSEQKKIVKTLDEASEKLEEVKQNAERNLSNSKEFFESYLANAFCEPKENWNICNLEEYIKLIDYRGRTPVKTESGVRLITAKNVKLGYLQLEPQEYIASNNYDSWMTRGVPNFGDVIFTTEAPLANVAQIDTKEKIAFAQRIIVMQPDRKVLNQTFLKYLLLSRPIRSKILEKGTGATVQGIKSSLLKKISIYFPKSLQEQEIVVKKLDHLSEQTIKLESIYQSKLSAIEELKKSILHKVFSGEL